MNDREQQRQDQRQEDRIAALEKGQLEVLNLLRPIAETYASASKMGKWLMALLVFISIMIGIVLSLKSLFHIQIIK